RVDRRRPSSAPRSMPSSTPAVRSSSPPTGRLPISKAWTSACARGSRAGWWSKWDRWARNCALKSSNAVPPPPDSIIPASMFPPPRSSSSPRPTHNGRDLEGALNRLLAHSKLTGQPVTLEMAEREVRDLIRPQEPKRVKIEDIQRVVARQYNVSRADLLSSRRTANVVRPRQV